MGQAVPVNRDLGAVARVLSMVMGAALTVTLLAGCADAESTVPLTPVSDPSAHTREQAQLQAERLALVLQALEDRFTLDPDAPGRPGVTSAVPTSVSAQATPAEASEQLSAHVSLSAQAMAFVQAQAAYLEDGATGSLRPDEIAVEVVDVEVVGTDPDGMPVARVVIETTSRYGQGPSSVSSVEYGVSWASERDEDAHGTQVTGTHVDGLQVSAIRPLYSQGGSPALDSGESEQSPSNAAHSYVRAITHGSSATISALEGTVRSSDDFRAVLKDRLTAAPRYTVVEVPGGQMGAAHVLFVIQEGAAGALRLDVVLGRDGPTVVPRL